MEPRDLETTKNLSSSSLLIMQRFPLLSKLECQHEHCRNHGHPGMDGVPQLQRQPQERDGPWKTYLPVKIRWIEVGCWEMVLRRRRGACLTNNRCLLPETVRIFVQFFPCLPHLSHHSSYTCDLFLFLSFISIFCSPS